MENLLTLSAMARRLRVPTTWLRDRADEGAIPCLKVGTKRYLFNSAAVCDAVALLAARSAKVERDAKGGDA